MFKKILFYDNLTNSLAETWSSFLLQGLVLILIGVMVVLFPQLIAAMVAATFIFMGLIFISIALKTRALRRKYTNWKDEFWEPF